MGKRTRRRGGRVTLDYEIKNVGGIDHVKLVLEPGVNVLRGANAAGKTSAMRAVVRAQGGKMPLERRDGSERGTVIGPGVTLNVRQVVKATGEAELNLADSGPLARLIDPRLKNTDAAARERIRALVELLELEVDDESLRALCPGAETPIAWLRREVNLEAIDNLLEASEKLKARLHALAREDEEGAARATMWKATAESRSAKIREELAGGGAAVLHSSGARIASGSVDETPAAARKAFDEAIREHERAVARCDARDVLNKQQRAIRATLGDRPLVDVGIVEGLERDVQKAKGELSSAQARVVDCTASLAHTETLLDEAKKVAARARRDTESWDAQDTILREPLEGPTPEEVDKLEITLVQAARRRLWRAEKSDELRKEEADTIAAEREEKAATKKAARYRELADAIPARLGEILHDAGAPGLTVIDGRLNAHEGGRSRDFEHRCSTGERVALALDVAAAAYAGKVLPLDGEFWTSLDPEHRAAFHEIAIERGLYVLTEEPTAGELRVEGA